jgi:hypothetical protein
MKPIGGKIPEESVGHEFLGMISQGQEIHQLCSILPKALGLSAAHESSSTYVRSAGDCDSKAVEIACRDEIRRMPSPISKNCLKNQRYIS